MLKNKFENENEWKPEGDDTSGPQPLFRDLPEPEPFPIDALGATLAPAARAMMETIQAPDAICGQSLLAASALAVQGHADVRLDGRTYPISLFEITVGQSGERKSEVDRFCLMQHRIFERNSIEESRYAFEKYENELAAYEAVRKRAVHRKSASVSEMKSRLDGIGHPPRRPPSQLMMVDEPTFEGLIKLLEFNRPSVGIFSDEGGRFIGGHAMNSDNQLKTIAGFSGLWDGRPISKSRAGEGSVKIFGKRVSMHLMVQHGVAFQITGNKTLMDQGFLSRCLISMPTSNVGNRQYRQADPSTNADLIRYNDVIKRILELPFAFTKQDSNEIEPRKLELSPRAKELWIAFHNEIEREQRENGKFSQIRGFASKAAEHALRVGSVLTLMEEIESPSLVPESLDAAIHLIRFYLSEARRLFDVSNLNPDLHLAEKLRLWAQSFNEIYPVLVYQKGPNAIRDHVVAKKMIQILVEHGHLRSIGSRKVDGAIRKEVFEVVK